MVPPEVLGFPGGQFIHIFGPPGAGKTTVMQRVRYKMGAYAVATYTPLPHLLWKRKGDDLPVALELGTKREGFSGSDTLSMSIIGKAEAWIAHRPHRLMFCEGDRLSNDRWFQAVKDAGYDFKAFYLAAEDGVLQGRRLARARELARPLQDSTWVRGRTSKAANLAAKWPNHFLDAAKDVNTLADEIMKELTL